MRAVEVGEDDGKLVAAQPREVQARFFQCRPGEQVAGAQLFFQSSGDGLQKIVAGTVPEGVVDPLEAVEIEEQQRHLALGATRPQQFQVELLEEALPIRHAGQRVEVRQAPYLLLVELLQGDVTHHHDHGFRTTRCDAPFIVMDAVGHRQLVHHRLQIATLAGALHATQNDLGNVARQDLRHLAAEEVVRRDVGLGAETRLVVEVDAVAIHQEDHVRHGAHDRCLLLLQFAQLPSLLRRAQHVACTVAENRPVDRFGDEVAGARLVSLVDRLDVVHAGDHDDRHFAHVPALANVSANGEAVHSGHVDVEQDQVGRLSGQQCQRLFAVGGDADFEVELGQRFLFEHAHHVVVVDDQHSRSFGLLRRGHGLSSCQ